MPKMLTLRTTDGKEFEVGPGEALGWYACGKCDHCRAGNDDECLSLVPRITTYRESRGVTYTPSDDFKQLLSEQITATREGSLTIENLAKAMMDLAKRQQASPHHDPFYDPGMDSMDSADYAELIENEPTNDWARAVHRAHDELYINLQCRWMLARASRRAAPVLQNMREYKRWRHVLTSGGWPVSDEDVTNITRGCFLPLVTRANTWEPGSAGAGAEFAPIGVSRTLIGVHRLRTNIVSAFPRVTIPRGVKRLDIPTLTSSTNIRVVAATTGAGPFPPQSTATQTNPATAVLTLIPKKHGSDILTVAVEEIEDATIAVVEALSGDAFAQMGKARENALINGQSTNDATFDIGNGPLPSNGYADSTTVGTGLRKWAHANSHTYDAGAGDMSLGDFEAGWEQMGDFGVNDGANSVGFLSSSAIWYDLIKDPALAAVSIAGRIATLPAGALMDPYGIPTWVSDQCPNVKNTGVIGDGTGLNFTFGIFVNFGRWRTGEARDVELRVMEPQLEDVLQMRTFARHCVGHAPPTTDSHTVLVYNVDKAP